MLRGCEQVSPTLGIFRDATVEHLSWHLESRRTTQWWGASNHQEIEIEMWGCLRCTVGMTGVSSPHLPVAAPKIRKPSNVLCYMHLNGSCIDEPWVAACGLGCILWVCVVVAKRAQQGDSAGAKTRQMFFFVVVIVHIKEKIKGNWSSIKRKMFYIVATQGCKWNAVLWKTLNIQFGIKKCSYVDF